MEINRKKFFLVFYVIGGSFIPIFQRYLTFYFDSFTQNFFRFFAGSLSLLLISIFFFRDELREIVLDLNRIRKIGLLAILSVLSQFLYIEGLSRTSAIMGGLMFVLGIPLTLGLTVLVFQDEKKVIKEKNFILGSFLVICGTIGFMLSKGNLNLTYSLGIIYLLIATTIYSIANLLIKKLVITSNPVCIGTVVSGFMCIIFLFLCYFFGCVSKVKEVSIFTNTVLFFSGAYGLIIGVGFSFFCIKKFGVIIVRLVELSIPVFTGIFGYFLLEEKLNLLQMVSAGILIIGCFLILKKEK
ncbi:DMT family transporter [bacterium]|nr:DMT family transporter [bacterium]